MRRASLLLLLACLSLCLDVISGTGCVRVREENTQYFVSAPQTPSPPLTNCPLYSGSSCCSSTYTDLVTTKTDPIHSKLITGVLQNLNEQCNATFDELACLYCSPDSVSFIEPMDSNSRDSVHLCESFCNRLYTACADAFVVSKGKSVSTAFHTGKEFCSSDEWMVKGPFFPMVSSGDSQCFDSTGRACTSDDYEGHYSACVAGLREYSYSWKLDQSGQMPCSGGVPLPATKHSLRCDIACGAGTYLPGGETQCAPCPQGTFGIGGGESFGEWPADSNWPAASDGILSFSTYCQDTRTGQAGVCAGWEKHGAYITSGDNSLSHGIESILELDVVLIEAGAISFTAEVDSEPGFDGLRFEVSSTETHDIPITGDLMLYSFNLTKGPHLLRWVYYKDDLWSSGSDMAIITVISVEGLRYADEHCTKCPGGSFQPNTGKAQCQSCSMNLVPAADAKTCVPCSSTEYSFPGDATCRTRPSCTANDYEVVYSDCRAPGVRDKTYQFIVPQYCIDTDHVLPPASVVDCEPCNPGEYRGGNFKCRFCQEGYSSPGGEATACTQCLPGSAAIKSKTFTTFEKTLPSSWSTGCDRCSSGGWEAHYDILDTGEGDGLFTSWLEIRDTWYTKGSANFTVSFECPASDCSLTLWVDDDLYYHTFSTGNSALTLKWNMVVLPGNHTIFLDFSRWVPWLQTHDHAGTRAIVHSIFLSGTEVGGAAECSTCPEGTTTFYGNPTVCQACPAGKVVDPDTHRCTNCPIDTIADKPGMKACLPCGPGTSTKGLKGKDDCDNNDCTFGYVDDLWPVQFNFSALSRADAMWGPVYDPVNRHSYWINICTKDHVNNTCQNADGTPMATFACQIIGSGASKDLGRVMGYHYEPPSDMGEEKVVISYDYGTPCVLPSGREGLGYYPSHRSPEEFKKMRAGLVDTRNDWVRRDTVTVERKTNVTLICDPTAGLGTPIAPPAGIEDPSDRCRYDFVWYSLYACHICSENDYDYYYTPCLGGLHSKTYYWKYTPRRCWGGISSLPLDKTESCTPSTILCADGQYVSPKTENCSACPSGNYSIGGGVMTQWWSLSSLTDFVTYCENDATGLPEKNCRGGWTPNGSNIKAKGVTVGTSAVLSAERNFIREGTVYFDYSLLTDNGEPLSFFMDDKLVQVWNHTTITGKGSFIHTKIPKGTHVFKWKYAPFIADGKPRIAQLWKVIFNGTTYSESSCNPCQGRTVQENAGASSCHTCPINTVYDGNPYKCNSCPEGTYALPGETTCTQAQPCTDNDYYEVYAECTGGKRGTYYLPYTPVTCRGGTALPNGRSGLQCECPMGFHLVGDECQTCPPGKFYNGITCIGAEKGTTVMKVKEFLSTAQGTAPQFIKARDVHEVVARDDFQFVTGCSGDCGTPGWRFLGSSMDSGVHNGTSYSWVYFNATLDVDGEIMFSVDLSTHHELGPDVALEFYIDNVAQNLVRQAAAVSVSYPVTRGSHRFLWVHNQEPLPASASLQQSKVWNIRVFGIKAPGGNVQRICEAGYMGDGNSQCTPCTPGYFSELKKQSECTPCPYGKFSSDSMATACTRCGPGTTPNRKEAATGCVTTCVFDVNTTTPEGVVSTIPYRFDLTPFRKLPPISIPSPNSEWHSKFTMQVCEKMTVHQTTNPCQDSTFVCEENESLHRTFDAGSLLSFIPNTLEDEIKPYQGFMLEYSMGSDASCAGKQRKSVFHFSCKLGAAPYIPIKFDYAHREAEAKACEYHFLVETEHACPICELDRDIRIINGECLDGKREIKYEPIIACINPPPSQTEACSNIEVNEFAILVIAGAVALVVASLVGVAIYFWNKKRQVAQKYELLVAETSAPVELQEVDRED